MPQVRQRLGGTVLDKSIERLAALYGDGHRLVVSFSGGKDSGAVLECAIMAARVTDRLPVEVVMRDEEVMLPGTFEYCERMAAREEVSMTWLVPQHPVVNIFNREQPYWWTFDPLLDPSDWMRKPPDYAVWPDTINIDSMTNPERFPPEPGKTLYAAMGLRVSESHTRLYGLFSAKGHITKPNRHGVRNVWPIYDWADGDVWKAHAENGWDYNRAYDVMHRLGISRSRLRIAPPTLNAYGAEQLKMASKAWPRWFEALCNRLPGVRLAAMYGKRAVTPYRRDDETWEEAFHRTCIEEAPAWIAERAAEVERQMTRMHAHHSTTPFPEATPCYHCKGRVGSWKAMTNIMYAGDPFSLKQDVLGYVEPEVFRPGAGRWDGKPSF